MTMSRWEQAARRLRALEVVVAVVAAPLAARAEGGTAMSAIAEQLFERGKEQMAAGRHEEACATFAESYRLEPATGTLLNLATCHEATDKLASAWVEFRDAADTSARDGRASRVRYAREHLAALEARVAHLSVVVPEPERAKGFTLSLDGKALGVAAWSMPVPLDAGNHEVLARADDGREWRRSVVMRDGETVAVQVDLPADPKAPAPPPVNAPKTPAAPASAAVAPPTRAERIRAPPAFMDAPRVAGTVLGGAGLLAAGVGAYFGLLAFSLWGERMNDCPGGRCSGAAVDAGNRANTAASVANWSLGAGGVVFLAGTALLVWPRPIPPAQTSSSTVALSFDGGSLRIGGTF